MNPDSYRLGVNFIIFICIEIKREVANFIAVSFIAVSFS